MSTDRLALLSPIEGAEDVALVDLADRLLDKGVAIAGDLVISVAGVDLVYISLRALVASVETALELHLAEGAAFR